MPDKECSAEERHLRELFITMFEERDRQYRQRFEAQEKAVLTALTTSKEAVQKAEAASEKRFESLNEFRGQLRDQQNTLMTRVEYNAKHEQLEDRVNEINKRLDQTGGRSEGVKAVIAYIVAAASAIVALTLWVLEHKG